MLPTTMNTEELSKEAHRRANVRINQPEVRKIVNAFVDAMTETLDRKDGRVMLARFGILERITRRNYKKTSPYDGKPIVVKQKNFVRWKPSKTLKRYINM